MPLPPYPPSPERVAEVEAEMKRVTGSSPVPEDLEDEMCPNCVTPWKCNGPHLKKRKYTRMRNTKSWRLIVNNVHYIYKSKLGLIWGVITKTTGRNANVRIYYTANSSIGETRKTPSCKYSPEETPHQPSLDFGRDPAN